MRSLRRLLAVGVLLVAVTPRVLFAQRELHWDALDVTARLDADGVLEVAERHTMVFTGDWNGGERLFNIRPRQKLDFVGIDRIDATTNATRPLQQTSIVPNNVDEFVFSNARTLRWRSRLPSDPPFANTRLVYVLHYKLSGILLKDAEQYQLDHDFAFPDRVGPIARFTLDLALDPVWRPLSEVRQHYTAGPLAPGRSFVLTIPLQYSGTGSPIANDNRRPPEIVGAVAAIFAAFVIGALVFYMREQSLGRFAPLSASGIDATWMEQNILAHPAEVVGAAWDDKIGAPEVVALIARMTGEGKLESTASGASMTLLLKVDRNTLDGYERALVDGLFFNGRTETSTAAVQQHYKNRGFDPAHAIMRDLNIRVHEVVPPVENGVSSLPTVALALAGAGLLGWTAYNGDEPRRAGAFALVFALVFGGIVLQIPGWLYRARMDRGLPAAAVSLIPALLVSLAAAGFLWMIVGTGRIELPWTMIGGIAAWAICISNASINGLESRQTAEAIAFRKRLTAGRRFFETELAKPNPALRDRWYPWLLAFGLGKQVDDWSTRNETTSTRSSTWDRSTSSSSGASASSSSSSSDNSAWSGGGGRSGGAGGGATWAAAAAGMAVGVSAPSSSSSSGGGGSSSGGGSSGGGGGGGW